jgi:hypothetical protein
MSAAPARRPRLDVGEFEDARPALRLVHSSRRPRWLAIIRVVGSGPAERPPRRRYFTERLAARRFAAEWRRRGFAVRIVAQLW